MSTTIRVSYERPEELVEVLRRLGSLVKRKKLQPAKGRYKLAYLWTEDAEPAKRSEN